MTLDNLISVLREEAHCLDEAAIAIERLIHATDKREEAVGAIDTDFPDIEQRAGAREVVLRLQGDRRLQ